MMEYREINRAARKVASILAENEATVADMANIFSRAKEYLTVSIRPEGLREDLLPYIGGIYIPDETRDGDGSGDE